MRYGDSEDLLLTTANDEHLGIGTINIRSSLLLPADGPGHMSIKGRDLRKLLQLLGDSVHCINLPAILGEDGVDNSRRNDDFCLKRHNELQLGKVFVGPGDFWSRCKELEIGCFCYRKEVGRGFEDGGCEVEGAVVPREGKLVSPNSCTAESVGQSFWVEIVGHSLKTDKIQDSPYSRNISVSPCASPLPRTSDKPDTMVSASF